MKFLSIRFSFLIISCLSFLSITFVPFLINSPTWAHLTSDRAIELTQARQPSIPANQLADTVAGIEQNWEQEYRQHLNQKFSTTVVALDEVEATLRQVKEDTKSRAAFI